jgi:hypothetical protein
VKERGEEKMDLPDLVIENLLPYQIPHICNLIRILENKGVALDCSDTGTGKSEDGPAIASALGLNIIFIGPKSGIPNLYAVCDKYKLPPGCVLGNVNYETLKNNKYYANLDDYYAQKRIPCPYINVVREQERNPITKEPVYTPTGKPKMIIKRVEWKLPDNTLIIFDEAHKGRNGKCSGKTTANSKLMVSVRPYLSKVKHVYGLFLSATLTDQLSNFDVIAYILGLYRPYHPKMYGQWLRQYGRDSAVIYTKVHGMLFPNYASRMSIKTIKEETGNSIFGFNDVKAETYPVDKETAAEIEKNHQKIQEILMELRAKGISEGYGRTIRYWQRIEALKVPTVAEQVVSKLQTWVSVVVFVNFTNTKNLLYDHVLEAGRGIITADQIDFIDGSQTAEQREEIVNNFRDDKTFVLIANIKAGGTAISLHPRIGGQRQRHSIAFPTWSATDLKQALGRIYRANAGSDAFQRIFYCVYKDSEEKESDQRVENESESDGEKEKEVEERPTLSIEEMLCRNVNIKLENIELLNNGNLFDLLVA